MKISFFLNSDSLSRNYIPPKLYYRDEAVNELINIYREIFDGKGIIARIGGDPDTGKTVVARFFMKQMEKLAKKNQIDLHIEYVDFSRVRSNHWKWHMNLASNNFQIQIPSCEYSFNELRQELQDILQKEYEHILVILDHCDMLEEHELLEVKKIIEEKYREDGSCSFLFIKFNYILPQERNSWKKNKISLKPYNLEEIKHILRYRSSLAYKNGIMDDEILDYVAQLAENFENLSLGIDILKKIGITVKHKDVDIDAQLIRNVYRQLDYEFYFLYRKLYLQLEFERDDNLDDMYNNLIMYRTIAECAANNTKPYISIKDIYKRYKEIENEFYHRVEDRNTMFFVEGFSSVNTFRSYLQNFVQGFRQKMDFAIRPSIHSIHEFDEDEGAIACFLHCPIEFAWIMSKILSRKASREYLEERVLPIVDKEYLESEFYIKGEGVNLNDIAGYVSDSIHYRGYNLLVHEKISNIAQITFWHDYNGIKSLHDFQYIDLSMNSLTTINSLEKLTDLEILILSNNKINKIDRLHNQKKLEGLYLDENEIEEISGLDSLCNLKIIDLSKNKLTKIKALENTRTLQYLNLNFNNIKVIKGLDNLENLHGLYLLENNIEQIKGLDNLKELEYLNLSGNHITEIKGLDNLTNLKSLHLVGNNITEIKGLEHLHQLESLQIGGNPIPQDVLHKLGGINKRGYAYDPQAFVEYCHIGAK